MVETISFNTFTAFSSREDFFSSAPSALLFSFEPSLASSLTTFVDSSLTTAFTGSISTDTLADCSLKSSLKASTRPSAGRGITL